MAGIDAATGRPLGGWAHVVQSLGVLFSTRFGQRVMRRYVGSAVPALLGQGMNAATLLRFFQAVVVAIELWEPRFRVTQVQVLTLARDGRAGLRILGVYRPRGHLGDFTSDGARQVALSLSDLGGLSEVA